MTTTASILTAAELKEADPRRFDREYSKWTEWQWDEWHFEDVEARFKEKYEPLGVHIQNIHYSLGYSQSDFASFTGAVYLTEWMEKVRTCPDGRTYAERYPALYLACKEDGSYININGGSHSRRGQVSLRESWDEVAPCGIFNGLPEEDWEALIEEQAGEADLEQEVSQYCRAIGRELYKALMESYEDVIREEAFIESCEANEITFKVEED